MQPHQTGATPTSPAYFCLGEITSRSKCFLKKQKPFDCFLAELIFVRGPWKKQTKVAREVGVQITWLIKPRDEKSLNPKIFEEDKQKTHTQGNKMWQICDEIGPIPRGPVFIFTVSLSKTSYHFTLKGKENAFCLSHWANDCSLADPDCTQGFLLFFFFFFKKRSYQGEAVMKNMGQSKWQWVHSWGHLSQRSSHYCNVFDICLPNHHQHEHAGKENAPVRGLCFILFFK